MTLKGSVGVDCDVIVKTVNAHLTVGKYFRLTNEITDDMIFALEYCLYCEVVSVNLVCCILIF
jgi:hypothetical protein